MRFLSLEGLVISESRSGDFLVSFYEREHLPGKAPMGDARTRERICLTISASDMQKICETFAPQGERAAALKQLGVNL